MSHAEREGHRPGRDDLPVLIIGAGPVGLAAAAHLAVEGRAFQILEAGDRVAEAVRAWGHVRLFTPWRYLVDKAARRLLEAEGWTMPDGDAVPTGGELVERYLEPLAALPLVNPHLVLGTRVTSVSRLGLDRMKTPGRDDAPFDVRADGVRVLAGAVIDASGTWGSPNPMGAGGTPAVGEQENGSRILYGIPDVAGRHRDRYAEKRVGVVGSGHSAFNTLIDLTERRSGSTPDVVWFVRSADLSRLWGGGDADELSERGLLGQRMKALVDSGRIVVHTGFEVDQVRARGNGVDLVATSGQTSGVLDEVVVVTGFRPDLSLTRELRLDLDPVVEAPSALAPLIDPNIHSCGTVPPHGHRELRHPEPGFYTVGMKSYGRAPTFLLLTGHEQVRSVVKALVGDTDAADVVELCLPETGVCDSDAGLVAAGAAIEGSCCS